MITDFLFDGKELSSFGYMLCTFDSVNLETMPVSELTYHTIKAPLSNTTRKTSTSYDSNLSKTLTICKSTCNSNNIPSITADDLSELSNWLCRKEYKWFRLISDDTDGMDETCYEAQINLQKIMLGDRCIGVELMVQTNRPYGVTPEIIIKSELNQETGNTMDISVYSDEEGYIYPNMTISLHETGTLEITNHFDGTATRIQDCTEGEIIHIYGDILQIESDAESHDIPNCFNYQFPRLCSTFEPSVNTFSFNLNCEVELKYRGIRKAGI